MILAVTVENLTLSDVLSGLIPLILAFTFTVLSFFVKKKRALSDVLLTIFFLFLGIILLEFFLTFIHEKIIALRLLIVFVPVFQALSPLKYLYIKSLSSLTPLNKKAFLHFIPSFLSMFILLVINLFFNSFIAKDAYWNMLIVMIIGGATILNLIYIPKSIIVYRKHKKNAGNLFSYKSGVDLKWMRFAIAGYVLFIISIALIEVIDFTGDDYFLPLVYTTYLFYLILNGLKQKPIAEIFNGDIKYQAKKSEVDNNIYEEDSLNKDLAESTEADGKYKSSSLKDDTKIKEIADLLINHLESSKDYLDPGLNLMDISRHLGINYKYISQAINYNFNKNFISLISEYRVNEAKQMIINPENNNYTLEAIGELCGFQSKSTFYTTFKKTTGQTPMQFKEISK